MREILIQEKRIILLDILSAVDKFCEQQGIVYSMACGTMLGAVRHKGFIPWDDDIDIYILRKDYNRLENTFPDILDGKYKFATLKRTKGWHSAFGKIYDDRTIYDNPKAKRIPIGINIDVYPIDDVPDGDLDWKEFRARQKKAVLRLRYKNLRLSPQNNLRSNLLLLWHKLPVLLQKKTLLLHKLDNVAQINNGKGYSMGFECCQGIIQQHPFPKELFSSVINWPFEDRQFKGFEKADVYLRNGYGDYMKLPPKEKQILVHGYKSYWK